MTPTPGTAATASLTAELQALDQTYLLHPHATVGHPQPPLVLVRGSGMMFGVELVDNAASVVAGAREAGVLVRGSGTTIILCPPLVIEREQAQRIVDVLADQIRAAA